MYTLHCSCEARLLQANDAIHTVQALFEHNDLKTIVTYTHVLPRGNFVVLKPDDMVEVWDIARNRHANRTPIAIRRSGNAEAR